MPPRRPPQLPRSATSLFTWQSPLRGMLVADRMARKHRRGGFITVLKMAEAAPAAAATGDDKVAQALLLLLLTYVHYDD